MMTYGSSLGHLNSPTEGRSHYPGLVIYKENIKNPGGKPTITTSSTPGAQSMVLIVYLVTNPIITKMISDFYQLLSSMRTNNYISYVLPHFF